MSVAMPAAAAQTGGAVTLFGRRVSYDSLIVAGATLLGIFFVWKLNQSGTSAVNLGTPADAGAANPTLPTSGSLSATVATDPSSSVLVGGGLLASSVGAASTVAPRGGTGSAAPAAKPAAGGGLAAVARVLTGTIGTGGGPNTTGRSSGTQIYDSGATTAPASHVSASMSVGGHIAPHTVLPAAPAPAPAPAPRAITTGSRGGPRMIG